MRIGVDFDGVILDSERYLKFRGEIYNTFVIKKKGPIDKHQFYNEDKFGWKKEETERFLQTEWVLATQEANFIYGAKDILTLLKNEGHQIILITNRGFLGDYELHEAKKRLEEFNFPFDKMYFNPKSKLEVCIDEKIDIMIDDNTYNCKSISEYGIFTLFFRDKNMPKLPEGEHIRDVSNWGEIHREIVDYIERKDN